MMNPTYFYENYIEAAKHAAGDGPLLLLWGLSLVYILLFVPRARRAAIAILVVAFFVSNPLTGGLALYVVETSQPYSRFVWLFFPELLTVVAACHLTFSRRSAWLRTVMGIACLALLVASGERLISREFFLEPENEYQISEEALLVGDYLLEKQAKENKNGHVFAVRKAERSVHTRAVVADALCYDIRQARSGVHLMYGRHGIKVKNRIESRLIASSDEEATVAYFDRLRREHVTAIVLQAEEALQPVMEHYGWIPEAEVAGYTVYVPEDVGPGDADE